MLQRLYVNNFRCLENFELKTKDMSSVLLLGKNGTGKSTVRIALELLRKIGRGRNRVQELLSPTDFARGQSAVPIRFEIEALVGARQYRYVLALELPPNFKEFRVLDEQLDLDGVSVFTRNEAQVTVYHSSVDREARFLLDWHLVALPIIFRPTGDPLVLFKTWLARMMILAPIPSLMSGESEGESLEPETDGSNFGEWFSGLLNLYPAKYSTLGNFLRESMPDFLDVQNDRIGENSKRMSVGFEYKNNSLRVPFSSLSDGEKCFFLCAVALAANEAYGPLFCFWDEPDSHLSLSEVGLFVAQLRRSFKKSGQILVTSHNPEAIRKFSDENTIVFLRRSHLEPTQVRSLSDMDIKGNLIDALILGEQNNGYQ
jgi:ABC-type multidrug transport system ATPase subunit